MSIGEQRNPAHVHAPCGFPMPAAFHASHAVGAVDTFRILTSHVYSSFDSYYESSVMEPGKSIPFRVWYPGNLHISRTDQNGWHSAVRAKSYLCQRIWGFLSTVSASAVWQRHPHPRAPSSTCAIIHTHVPHLTETEFVQLATQLQLVHLCHKETPNPTCIKSCNRRPGQGQTAKRPTSSW